MTEVVRNRRLSIEPFVCLCPSQPTAGQANRKKLEAVFGSSADDEADSGAPKRKLVPLDYEEETKSSQKEAEDKKKTIKSLIERIPTAKEELFAYTLDWTQVDQVSRCRERFIVGSPVSPAK